MILTVGLLTGCAGQPTEFRSDRETPEGPGMLSGEEGGWVLFGEKRRQRSEESSSGGPLPDEGEFREYQEWKERARESGEYEEFQDWLRWREYRRWQEAQ
ncbi:hypothetical protein CR157_21335 [Halomonas sp. LBP4]|nr:hypothetical protein CR157_21335 [Halomonas sp. LBP4]